MFHYDSPLLTTVFRYYHSVRSPLETLRDVHLGQMGSIAAMHSGFFGSSTNNISRYVRSHRQNCSVCLRSRNLKYNLKFGKSFGLLGKKQSFFTTVFVDPLFDINIRFKRGPNGVAQHTLCIIMCKNTYCVQLLLMSDKTRSSIRKALIGFMEKTGISILELIADHGPQFQLKPGEEFLPGVLLTTLLPRFQHEDLLERKVSMIKMYLRIVFHISKDEILRVATNTVNTLAILDIVVNVVNSLPYSTAQSHLPISPDMFLRPYKYMLQALPGDGQKEGKDVEIREIWSELGEFLSGCEDARDQLIKIKTDRFKQKFRQGKLNLEPKPGDICFVVSEQMKKARLCRLISVKNMKATVFLADRRQYKIYPLHYLNVMVAERDPDFDFTLDKDDSIQIGDKTVCPAESEVTTFADSA